MGDSTCLMSFSPGMPSESNKHGNYVHGLGDSVSFGRFTTESLAWDKWSNFPHKRYVEEAKSYAQPGSVAEKKAFFEAHYKKVAAQKAAAAAAAALLEQEKAKIQVEERVCATNHDAHDPEPPVLSKSCVLPAGIPKLPALHTMVLHTNKRQPPKLKLKLAANEGEKVTTHDASKQVDVVGHSSGVNLVETKTEKIAEASDPKHKELVNTAENLVDTVSVSEDSGTSQMDRPLLKSKNNDQEVLQPKIRRKAATPSFRSPSSSRNQCRIPHSPAYVASMHPWKENMVTPRAKNSTAMDSIDKKRSAPRSLYTLMNSGSVKESSKLTSPAVRKMETTKLASSIHSTPKRSATPKPSATPNITPKVTKGVNKQTLATPSVKRRMETPVHASAVGSKTPAQKWHLFSAVSKSLSAYKNKLQSPTVATPFTLRTEERAARRKQKLEEKFNEKEAQKTQLQTTLKEKAETEFRRLRQSFCFKARPLPSFYNERETPKSSSKKTEQVNLKSVTPAMPPSTTISQPPSVKKTSRRLWKTNDQNPTFHPLFSLANRINRENVSPNIQH
uniref:protein WVD2-like 4 isoform X2 n=1 Tax=Erigeron canadensis TaxID=72917 RepID=UPI001CB9377D|nr:protein WVD2-like 4 isoform X2 [Erigeron canadensis]